MVVYGLHIKSVHSVHLMVVYGFHMTVVCSGGMKRRLSVAMAFIARPKVIFLDEPSTGDAPITMLLSWSVSWSISYHQEMHKQKFCVWFAVMLHYPPEETCRSSHACTVQAFQ